MFLWCIQSISKAFCFVLSMWFSCGGVCSKWSKVFNGEWYIKYVSGF